MALLVGTNLKNITSSQRNNIMKRILLLTIVLMTNTVFAVECLTRDSLDKIGIHLGDNAYDIKKKYSDVSITDPLPEQFPEIEADAGKLSFKPEYEGYGLVSIEKENNIFVTSFDFNPKTKKIYRITIQISDLFNIEKPLSAYKEDAIKIFSLPKSGWQIKPIWNKKEIKKNGYNPNSAKAILDCEDYLIEVRQDFNEGKLSEGQVIKFTLKDRTPAKKEKTQRTIPSTLPTPKKKNHP